MPLQKISRAEVIHRLLAVFRQHGYEGTSLAMIAKEAGLQKASLYHLFPGGKEEMARVVLASVVSSMTEGMLVPMRKKGDPAQRLHEMIKQVREFYAEGQLFCLFDTLSLGGSSNPFREGIGTAVQSWAEALAGLAREQGATPAVARQRAERVLVTIQGALVLTRCLGDAKVFARSLRELPEILLRPGS